MEFGKEMQMNLILGNGKTQRLKVMVSILGVTEIDMKGSGERG